MAQVPAVRRSSYEISVMAKMKKFVWEYLRPLLGSKGPGRQLPSTQLVSTVGCLEERVCESLATCKREFLEANCGLASVPLEGLSW